MSARLPLAVGVELIQDISALSSPLHGYLKRLRHRVKTILADGTRTDTYIVDVVDRDPTTRDAVAIAVYVPAETVMQTRVLLRRQVRYGAYLAAGAPLVTEVLAGLIEGEDPRQTVVREAWEEAGLRIEVEAVATLGPPFFALPSILTERVHPMAVAVSDHAMDEALASSPIGDGSPFEEGAEQIACTLGEALDLTQVEPDHHGTPYIADARTELVLARLAAALDNRQR